MADHTETIDEHGEDRRDAVTTLTKAGMAVGITAAYGTFAAFLGRFLFPAKPRAKGWMFVASLGDLKVGDSFVYRTPGGSTVNIARMTDAKDASSCVALSSTCPHLGCQVHWEPGNNRFFCPCHNGTFDPSGKATGGPPGEAGQSLPKFPLEVRDGLLYIEVPLEELAMGEGEVLQKVAGPPGPGHDPCLYSCSIRRA
jgi:Rieske Fe-S protein